MHFSLAAMTLVLLITTQSAAQEWIEYTNRTDSFAVNLPGEPRMRDITYQSEYFIDLPGRVYSAEDGLGKYSVTVIDYRDIQKKHLERGQSCEAAGGDGDFCNERSATDLRGAIDYSTWGFLQRNAKLTHFVYTQADRVEGRSLHLNNSDGSRTFAAIYMHENRLYIIEGTVPAGAPEPLVFHQSMQFLDKDGKSIRYESAYSNGFPPPPRAR